MPRLFASFFAPYKRITEDRPRGFDLEAWAGAIIINLMSRIIGILIRTVLIITGFIVLIAGSMVAMTGYILWLGAPIVIAMCYIFGLYWLFLV